MSQFGFFNNPQQQPPPARPAFGAYPSAPSAVFDAPRPYHDPYARAPSPPRREAFYGGASSMGPPMGGGYLPPQPQPQYAPPAYQEPPQQMMMAPMMAPSMMAPSGYYPPPAVQPVLAPPPPQSHYDMRPPDNYGMSSWRGGGGGGAPAPAPPPQPSNRVEFFSGNVTDTWRSSMPRSQLRDREYVDAGFARRDRSPERRPFRINHRSPPRREDREWKKERRTSRFEPVKEDRRETKDRKSHEDRDKRRERSRSRSRERKREERKDSRERDAKSRSRSRERDSKEKENGEKKHSETEEEAPVKEEIKEPDEAEAKDEREEREEDDEDKDEHLEESPEGAEVIEEDDVLIEEDEVEDLPKEAEEKAVEEVKIEEKKNTEKPVEKSKRHEDDRRHDRTDERQSRIRSPSVEKRRDTGFKVLKDATFDQIHLPGRVPYARGGGRSFERPIKDHHHDKPHRESRDSSSWAEQWKAKVMITKTAVHGNGGAPPPGGTLPPPVQPLPVVAALPPPSAPYDAYGGGGAAAYAAEEARAAAAAYPPLAPRPPEYAYGLPPGYGMPPRAVEQQPPPMRRPEVPTRAEYERDMYERRRPDEGAMMRGGGRSPPRRDSREYYEDRYLDREPGAKYVERYEESMRERERESRRPLPPLSSSRRDRSPEPRGGSGRLPPRPPQQPTPIVEIDASKLVEPLEDDGWDDVARMLSPEKVVIEKKTKTPLLANAPPMHGGGGGRLQPLPVQPPPMHSLMQHARTVPREPAPVPPPVAAASTGGFFSATTVPSVRSKIAHPNSQPFYESRLAEEAAHSKDRGGYYGAPPLADERAAPLSASGYAPPLRMPPAVASDPYRRALSYDQMASANGAAAYRNGPAPGWERGGGGRGY